MAKRLFTRRADSSGWLSVRLGDGSLASLCEYTAVDITHETGGRTYFVVADGWIAVGKEASLTSANAARYLAADGPGGAATLTVSYNGAPTEETSPFKGKLLQQWATLSFDGQVAIVTLNSVWNGQFHPIAPGSHAILAPDYSHAAVATTGYAAATPGMIGNDVWFPIGLNGQPVNSSRYVHVGHLSDGCVTVHQLERWTAVYQYLISRRAPGSAGKRVGTLVVNR